MDHMITSKATVSQKALYNIPIHNLSPEAEYAIKKLLPRKL